MIMKIQKNSIVEIEKPKHIDDNGSHRTGEYFSKDIKVSRK